MAECIEQAAFFDQHGGTPYPLALDLPLSFARAYMQTNIVQAMGKGREAQQKLDHAVIDRLNLVIKSLGSLAKLVNNLRPR